MAKFLRFKAVYDNSFDPYIPEFWAMESLIVLNETMVAANLVHRDFEPLLASYGDTVNTRKPSTFKTYRKTDADEVIIQDASATNVQVVLDQMAHTSFMIKDGEASKSMKNLVDEFLKPAVISMARFVDTLVLGQYSQFLDLQIGRGLTLDTTNARDSLLDLRQQVNQQKVPEGERILIVNNTSETTFLKLDLFTQAQQVGDGGTALQKATLGEKFGFNIYRAHNMASVATGNTVKTGAVNNANGYAVGVTVLVVDGFTGAVATGAWLNIAGQVYRIAAHTESTGNTTGITLHRGLDRAVVDNDIVTAYTPAAVNNGPGYAAGYGKEITINSTTVAPRVGQAVTFGTATPATTNIYTIIDVNGLVGITLDRPLAASIANGDAVNLGPAGNYNFTFHRNAVALVNRPLALPPAGLGARSGVVNANGLSMRATLTYDGRKQGTLVTLDMLLGVKVLDSVLGSVLIG